MIKHILITIALLVFGGVSYFISLQNFNYIPEYILSRISWSFIIVALLYFVFKFILDDLIAPRASNAKFKYTIKKASSILFFVILTGILILLWVENTDTIILYYGLISAGIAFSLQEFFKNVTGGITLFFNHIYVIGDRIEIDRNSGDVIDIGILNTTLMEIQGWVDGDQPTGRLIVIPNGKILSHSTFNYTKDHGFIWDEIKIPITYISNIDIAKKLLLKSAANCTKINQEQAAQGMKHLGRNYYLEKKTIDPQVFVQLTDNWISLTLRYITGVRDRRATANAISELVLKSFAAHPDIVIASQTIEIVKN